MGSWDKPRFKGILKKGKQYPLKTTTVGELYRSSVSEDLERRLDAVVTPAEATKLFDTYNSIGYEKAEEKMRERFGSVISSDECDWLTMITYLGFRKGE